jgi:hypothetical protein
MGLNRPFLDDLIALKRLGASIRRVAEIGAQQLADTFLSATDALGELYGLFDREQVDLGKPVGPENFAKLAPSSDRFWRSLGIECIPIDLARDAVRIDLNRGSVPAEFAAQFDLVVNAGTTEHVANQDNAFRVIHDLAKAGGVMWHEVPTSGMQNHGYFLYHPKFFIHLYRLNDYELLKAETDKYEDGSLLIYAFKKRNSAAFVTPLDVPQSAFKRKTAAALRFARRIIT